MKFDVKLDGPPDVRGWTWKQIIMAGFLAVAAAINNRANASASERGRDD